MGTEKKGREKSEIDSRTRCVVKSFQVAVGLNDINSCEVHKQCLAYIKCSVNVTFVIFIQSISIIKIE